MANNNDDQVHDLMGGPAADDSGTTPWRTAFFVGKQKSPDGRERVMFVVARDDYLNIVLFMDSGQAEELAAQLLQMATEIKTGLVLPPLGKIQTAG